MRYMGGKWRLRKRIAEVLHQFPNERYLEPFVGGASVLAAVSFTERTASDAHAALISMYLALQNGWQPPTELSEQEFLALKAVRDPSNPLTAFAGFGCSFGGDWFKGYAASKRGDNFVLAARNSLLVKVARFGGVSFMCADYRSHNPQRSTVYCDPPYTNTWSYRAAGKFDNAEFWEIMRTWSVDNDVIISEYVAPDDFECIAEFPTKLGLRTSSGQNDRIERLFKWKYK